MMPASLGPNHERGYYIIWDTISWRKERVRLIVYPIVLQKTNKWTQRELTLHYGDLETNLAPAA